MNKSKSLKREILQLLIVFSIVVIVCVGAISMQTLYSSKLGIINHNQNQVLTQVEHEVNNFLEKTSSLAKYISLNYEEDKSLIKNIVNTNANISSILILNNKGIIEDFYAISNLNIYKGFDYSNKKYFKNLTFQNKETYWSSVFLSTVDEEPTISYSIKAQNRVIVLMIKLSELSQFMKRFKNYDDSHIVRVFDKDGIMIINPDAEELVVQRYNASSTEIYTKLVNAVEPYTQVIFNPIKNMSEQYGSYTSIPKTKWKVVVRQNYQDIITSLKNIILAIIVSIIVFIIISTYLSLKISKRVFNSFDDLQKTTNQIANGNYENLLKQSYYEEFNNLLNSFNKMQIEIDRREDTLEASLNSFKSLFNSTMEIMILHKDGYCVDINDAALKFLGYENKNLLIGKKFVDLIGERNSSSISENISKDTLVHEFKLTTNEGKELYCLGRGQLITINSKNYTLSTFIDVTELKHKDRLLFQQSKMASMGEMIGNIAHQWRQPLSVITTCASGLKFENEFGAVTEDKINESMDTIVNNTKYLSRTIDDFRNFFKKDKTVEEFNVRDNIDKSLQLLNASLKNSEIDIDVSVDENLKVDGFPNEFLQVLINIINNSKDAFLINNLEHRYISIRAFEHHGNCIIEIEDNAGGIESNILENIFDPYFTTKHKSKGTGIGLYMSHQIIHKHMGGKLSVKNSLMHIEEKSFKGATFIIKLPTLSNEYRGDYVI